MPHSGGAFLESAFGPCQPVARFRLQWLVVTLSGRSCRFGHSAVTHGLLLALAEISERPKITSTVNNEH